MNKNRLAYIFSFLMIVLGSILEIYFYIFRFRQDGINMTICWIISAALTLLMSLAVYKSEQSKRWIILIIIVGIFSVISTSAGQTFSLLVAENEGIQEAADNSADLYTQVLLENLDSLTTEADGINETLAGITSIENEAMYRTTARQARDRLAEISSEKLDLLKLLEEKNAESSTVRVENIRSESIYEFYGSIGSWTKTDWIKFSFHTVLSILIALMAPAGILTWPKKQIAVEEPDLTEQEQDDKLTHEPEETTAERPRLTVKIIREYISRSFYRVSQKTSDFIIPKDVFFNFMKTQEREYSEKVYDYLTEKCVELGIFDIRGLVSIKDEEEALKIIVNNLKKEA